MSFCSLVKEITPKICMLGFVLTNSDLMNLSCIWIKLSRVLASHIPEVHLQVRSRTNRDLAIHVTPVSVRSSSCIARCRDEAVHTNTTSSSCSSNQCRIGLNVDCQHCRLCVGQMNGRHKALSLRIVPLLTRLTATGNLECKGLLVVLVCICSIIAIRKIWYVLNIGVVLALNKI